MKMKIDFDESSMFSNDEKTFFRLLSDIKEFVDVVAEIRKACNINQNGVLKMYPISKERMMKIDFTRLIKLSSLLTTKKLRLVPDWTITILAIILGCPLIKPKTFSEEIEIIEKDDCLLIKVKNEMSRNALSDFITDNESLKTILKNLPKRKISINKKNLFRNLLFDNFKKRGIKIKDLADAYNDLFDSAFGENDINVQAKRMSDYLDKIFKFDGDKLLLVTGAETLEEQLENT